MVGSLIVLAGGESVRFGGKTAPPKPVAELLGAPMIEHVVQPYLRAGVRDIHVATGSNTHAIRTRLSTSDIGFHIHDTGPHTASGGRINALMEVVDNKPFHLCYADGIADLDVRALTAFHRAQDCAVTATLCHPRASYGVATVDGARITKMDEKPLLDQMWVNGGFYVVDPTRLPHIDSPQTSWEEMLLPQLAATGQLAGYRHTGQWVTVDSQKDIPTAEAALRGWGAS